MSVIIDLAEYADLLNAHLRQFVIKYKIDPGQPTEKEMLDFVYDLLDVRITNLCLWAQHDHYGEFKAIEKLFPWWQPKSQEDLHVNFYEEVVVPIKSEIINIVNYVTVKSTWLILSLKRQRNSVIISKGEDYRIVDWNRIQEEKRKEEMSHDVLSAGLH